VGFVFYQKGLSKGDIAEGAVAGSLGRDVSLRGVLMQVQGGRWHNLLLRSRRAGDGGYRESTSKTSV